MRGLCKIFFVFVISLISFGQKPNDITIIEVIDVIFPSSISTDPMRNLSFYKESINNEYFSYSKYINKKEVKKILQLLQKLKNHPKTKEMPSNLILETMIFQI